MSGHANALLMLFLAFAGARLLGHVFARLKLPIVVGELLAGAILGPQLLDLVHSSEVMDAMAELGVIMLLFMAGLETHMAELMETRVAAVKVAVLGAALPFVGGLLVGLLFGWGSGSALFMATALTATSVGITVRALRELGHSERRAVRIILAAAVLDDVLGLIVLVVVSGTTSGSIDAWNLALLIVEAIAYVGLIGFFGPRLVIRLRDWLKDLQRLDPVRDRRDPHAGALAARRLHRAGGHRRRLHRRPHHERAQAAHRHREALRAAGVVLHAVLLRAHGHLPRLRRVRQAVGAARRRRVHGAGRGHQVPGRVDRRAQAKARRWRARSAWA